MAGAALELTEPILAEMAKRHPTITVELEHHLYDDPTAGLLAGSTDVAFLRPPLSGTSISSNVLFVEPRVAVMSARHELASRSSVQAADLERHVLTRPDGPDDRWNAFWALARTRDRCFPARTLEEALEHAASSQAVTIAALGWARYFPRKGLVAVPIADIADSALTVARLKGPQNEHIRAFVRIARSVAAERLADVPFASKP
jgi:DNA-binding transcriptional LysR family regulator